MKERMLVTSLAAGAVLLGGGVFAAAQATGSAAPVSAPIAVGSVVNAETADALRFAREEERMARDLYAALADKYDGAMPFAMITRSEQRHFDAVGALLDRYGVSDPSKGAQAGSYADPTLQKLYDQWLKRGQTSVSAAYDVGVELEQRDIADLEKTLTTTSQSDVRQVFTALLNASRHHLAAFQAAADGRTWAGGFGPGDGTGYGMGQRGQMGPGSGTGSGMGYGRGAGSGQGMMRGPGAGDCPMLDTVTD